MELRRRLRKEYVLSSSAKKHRNDDFDSEFADALMRWEAELRAYERETGKTLDKDTATVVLHVENLNTKDKLWQSVENYLSAKKRLQTLSGKGPIHHMGHSLNAWA